MLLCLRQRLSCSPRLSTLKDYSTKSSYEKVSRMFRSFIESESIALSQSLGSQPPSITTSPYPIIPALSTLDSHTRRQLDHAVDSNTRLFTLISYPASIIHPDLYCHFYNILDQPLTTTHRNLILKRLVYHRRFLKCWNICLQTHTQLNDIEEFIDICLLYLNEYNDSTFGLFSFISSSQLHLESSLHTHANLQLQHHVLETFCFKLNKPKDWLTFCLSIERKVSCMKSADHILEIMSSHDDPLIIAVCAKRLFQISGAVDIPDSQLSLISRYPGWLSYILSVDDPCAVLPSLNKPQRENYPSAVDCGRLPDNSILDTDASQTQFFRAYPASCNSGFHSSMNLISKNPTPVHLVSDGLTHPSSPNLGLNNLINHINQAHFSSTLGLNSFDITVLLTKNMSVDWVVAFLKYRKSMKTTTLPRDPSNIITNHIMLKLLDSNDYNLSKIILSRATKVIDQRLVVRFLIQAFKKSHLEFNEIARNLSPRQDYPEILDAVLSDKSIHPLSVKELEIMLYLITKCPQPRKTMEKLMRPHLQQVINKAHLKSLYGRLIAAKRMRKPSILGGIGILMLLDSRIIDQKLIGRLLNALIQSTLANEFPRKNREERSHLHHHDIQRILGQATYSERAQFHNSIRQLGVTIAKLDAHEIAQTLGFLKSFIMSDKFTFVKSEYGKSYIADILTDETVKFIVLLHKADPEKGLSKLQSIMCALKQPNERFLKWLVKFTVQYKPQVAFDMLHAQENCKISIDRFMKYIMLGILHSTKMDLNDKVDFLHRFVNESINLGVQHRIRQVVLYNIISLLKSSRSTNQKLSPAAKDWLIALLKCLKSIHRVAHIHNWAQKSRLRLSSVTSSQSPS